MLFAIFMLIFSLVYSDYMMCDITEDWMQKPDVKRFAKVENNFFGLENIVIFHKYMLTVLSDNEFFNELILKRFSVLISNMVNIYSCNPH